MTRQQYNAIRHALRERWASITHIGHFPVDIRPEIKHLLYLRDRADMLAERERRLAVDGRASSVRRRVLGVTSSHRVMRKLAAKYPSGLAEAYGS